MLSKWETGKFSQFDEEYLQKQNKTKTKAKVHNS
jgi:hypothetical protein